jgi:hypothetical protein
LAAWLLRRLVLRLWDRTSGLNLRAAEHNEGPDKGPFLCVLAKNAQYGNVARERILLDR